ncbi:MAG TPA: hypothetical protein VKQ36_12650 [Ktedonobacterales bacterium]|nr:hypothetical protein [Ktedonobacterales bacterium]
MANSTPIQQQPEQRPEQRDDTGEVIRMIDQREAARQSRRTAIITGLMGLIAGGLAGLGWFKWPTAVNWAGEVTPQQARARENAAVEHAQQQGATGANSERQRITHEISQLGGVTLANAVQSAGQTGSSVTSLIVPLAQTTIGLSSDGASALQRLINAVVSAQLDLKQSNIVIGDLETIHQLLLTWKGNLAQLPIDLNAYADSTVQSHFPDAQTYLDALQSKINGSGL